MRKFKANKAEVIEKVWQQIKTRIGEERKNEKFKLNLHGNVSQKPHKLLHFTRPSIFVVVFVIYSVAKIAQSFPASDLVHVVK